MEQGARKFNLLPKMMVMRNRYSINLLTSAILLSDGAAMNTTYGVNSDVRKIFNAWGSTSKIAIFPSLWILRIVSSLVPYIASSWVPKQSKKMYGIIHWYFQSVFHRTIFQIFIRCNICHHFIVWNKIVATTIFLIWSRRSRCICFVFVNLYSWERFHINIIDCGCAKVLRSLCILVATLQLWVNTPTHSLHYDYFEWLTWNWISVFIRIFCDKCVFDMTTTDTMSTKEHKSFPMKSWITDYLIC